MKQKDIDIVLARLSQSELIVLVKKMLQREPHLESLLPLVSKQQQITIQPALYQRKVEHIFRTGVNRWGSTSSIADDLLDITDDADEFAAQQNYDAAVTIYECIVQSTFQHYEEYDDESGGLASVLDACVTAMDNWLNEVKDDTPLRERMLRLLFDIYKFDVELGGVGIAEDAPTVLLEYVTDKERPTVLGWTRDALSTKGGADYHLKWRNEHFGRLLLQLQEEKLDDETFLSISREAGLTSNVIERLLSLGHIDEAVREAEHVSGYGIAFIADLFVQHGQDTQAESLVQKQYKQSHHWNLLDWLKKHYLAHNDYVSALALTQEQFQQSPDLSVYQELRQFAQRLNRWETLRPTLLATLNESHHSNLLIQIALDEGDLDKALSLVKANQPKQTSSYGFDYRSSVSSPILLQVAKAAEKSKPREAIDIYKQHTERLIAQRTRGGYAEACTFLLKIRLLYNTQLNATEEWTSYLTTLRSKYSNLPALKDEMRKAGVLD